MNKLTYWSDGKASPSSVTVKDATKNTVKKVFEGKLCNVLFPPFRLVSHNAVKHTRHQEKGPLLGALSA